MYVRTRGSESAAGGGCVSERAEMPNSLFRWGGSLYDAILWTPSSAVAAVAQQLVGVTYFIPG